jgi:CheY-like chemotaxis protein
MGARVLVVEDHATMREAMRMILDAEGFAVEEAADARAALDAAAGTRPALILLDLNIPGGRGLDVLSSLKEDPATSEIPVIVVTAEGEEGRGGALRRGAAGYLTKPFSPRGLLQAVERALAGSAPPGASP